MENAKQKSSLLGLTLQLEKYGVGSVAQKSQAERLIWGYYDNLKITKVRNWLEYSPNTNLVEDGKRGIKLVNYYPIKLLFPVIIQTDDFPPLFYEEWKEYDNLLNDNPCMSVVLMNFTDAYKEMPKDELLQDFLMQLKSQCDEKKLEKLHCCVMPTLGYSDFCLLMAGTEWGSALSLMEELHKLKKDSKPILATDYMMPVFHKSRRPFEVGNFAGCNLSVRVNVRPGTLLSQIPKDALANVEVFRPSGSSDYVFQAKDPTAQKDLVSFLLGSGGNNLVMDITSTLLYPLDIGNQKQGAVVLLPSTRTATQAPQLESIESFKSAISKYGGSLNSQYRHLRQVNSLYELSNLAESICYQPHSGVFVDIIDPLFADFAYCLNRCSEEMKKPNWDFLEMEHEVSTLCHIIDSFLADVSRADCFFMERERYNHASISSASSLLLAYNALLNQFTHDVRDATGQSRESNYSFLVTSGGRDHTQIYNAFHFLEPQEETDHDDVVEQLPLVTMMSEMSLFDFSGTLLRSFHECMHFCGIRNRVRRVDYLTDFVTSVLADVLTDALFQEEVECATAFKLCETLYPQKNQEKVLEKVRESFSKAACNSREKLKLGIKDTLMQYVTPDGEYIMLPKSYLAREVREWMYDILVQALSGYCAYPEDNEIDYLTVNLLANNTHNAVVDANCSFLESCANIVEQNGFDTAIFSFVKNKFNSIRASKKRDTYIMQSIQLAFSRLLIGTPPQSLHLPKNESIDYQRSAPYIALSSSNLVSTLHVCTDIFSESFSDVLACKILDAKVEDYLLMHIYEEWDLRYSLEKEMANNYRIPAVLLLCFPESVDRVNWILTDHARDIIEHSIERLRGHGMSWNTIDVHKLCEKVNVLLCEFGKKYETAKPLLGYLNECLETYKSRGAFIKLEGYAKIFEKVRLIDIAADEDDRNLKIMQMFYTLITRKEVGQTDEMQQVAERTKV